MITGTKTTDLAKALNYLKDLNIAKKNQLSSDTARNFFVAPEDIYSNCTNMTKIGILAY
jgi:DNA-binding transcriptional regulator GbsR (MarR family)